VTVQSDLGTLLLEKGLVDEAVTRYQAALAIQPANVLFLNNLAWVLATCPKPEFRSGPEPSRWRNSRTALAEPGIAGSRNAGSGLCRRPGSLPQALGTAQHALELATAQQTPHRPRCSGENIALFRAGFPFHERRPNPTFLAASIIPDRMASGDLKSTAVAGSLPKSACAAKCQGRTTHGLFVFGLVGLWSGLLAFVATVFVNLDDPLYVTENAHVLGRVHVAGIGWEHLLI